MLLMVEISIRGGMSCYLLYDDKNERIWQIMIKIKKSLHLTYWGITNLYGWAISQKLPVGSFNLVQNTSQFSKYSIKIHNEDSDEGYFLEADVQYPEKLLDLHSELPFLPGRMKVEKLEKLVANLFGIKEYITHIRILKKH